MFDLRGYQQEGKLGIYDAWKHGARNVIYQLPTGGGKTVTLASVIYEHQGASCVIAHRQELVSQISCALASAGILHNIIAAQETVKLCNYLHMRLFGRSFYRPHAQCAVAGINTLLNRAQKISGWLNAVTLWVMDEGHHILRENMWGKAVALFPNAKGLAVSATVGRADRKGLGSQYDGVLDVIVKGPSPADLIAWGYLTEYNIVCPYTSMGLTDDDISDTTGDYKQLSLIRAARSSRIVGDVVKEYLRFTPGKLGITFATDVETAKNIADEFTKSGVPAVALHAKTPDRERVDTIEKFKRREILQLVNVDLFGEGFDLPAIEVESQARPTQSLNLYLQMFGRVLRVMVDYKGNWDKLSISERRQRIADSGKPKAWLIDHVHNVNPDEGGHGLPDSPRVWGLERGQKRGKQLRDPDVIPVRICANPQCVRPYERLFRVCPYCGFEAPVAQRSGPEYVDGDLTLLDADAIAMLHQKIAHMKRDPEAYRVQLAASYMPPIGQAAEMKRIYATQHAHVGLLDAIAWWAGHQRASGLDTSMSYRKFYFKYGVDVLTAQTLDAARATELTERINKEIGR